MLELNEFKGMNYYLYKPENFDENKKYPLIVFMHGAGEREKVEDTLNHGPARSIREGMKIDAVILFPHCHGDNLWMNYYERVDELINIYRYKGYVDIDRVSLTGLSMGGYGSFDVCMMHPDYYSCLMPLCGGGKPFAKEYLKDVKVKIIHGDSDTIVNVRESIEMYEALKSVNCDCELVIMSGYGHDVWLDTYRNIENINWLINNVRKKH